MPIKPKIKKRNNMHTQKKLQKRPLTNKKHVLIKRLNKSQKYQ